MNSKILFYIKEAEKALCNEPILPVTCEIDPTTLCQNNCSFCINKESNKASHAILDLDVYNKLICELSSLNIKSVTFTGGGEPLLHPNFDELVMVAKIHNIKLGLITNGISLDKYLNLIPYFEFVRISLYGIDPSSYYKITSKDYFNRVIKNIEDAVKTKKDTTVGISYVLDDNLDEIDKAKELASNLKVDYIQFKPVLKTKLPNIKESAKTVLTQRYSVENDLPCRLAGLIGIVSADANTYYCCIKRGEEKYCLGNLKDDTFANLWKKRVDIMPEYKKCITCRYVNYVKGLESESLSERHFLKHRDFL